MKLNNPPALNGSQATYQVTSFDLNTYLDFIQLRTLPAYKVKTIKEGRKTVRFDVTFSASYLADTNLGTSTLPLPLTPGLFNYQEVTVKVAHIKERYAVFIDAGGGKTLILAELARQAYASEPGKILFCIPLNILHQFEEMVQEFFPDFPPFVHLHKSKMTLDEWLAYDDVPRIGFVNHEAFIKPHNLSQVSTFLLDECFVGDTLIDTPKGTVRIADIKPGDEVYNATGTSKVKATHKRYNRHLALTTIQGHDIISSINHPFLTQRGWIKAKDLKNTDYVIYTKDAMRLVWQTINREATSESEETRQSQSELKMFLQQELFCEMENVTTGNKETLLHGGSKKEVWEEDKGILESRYSKGEGFEVSNSALEPNEQSRIQKENVRDAEENRPQAATSGRQWKTDAETTENTTRETRERLDTRICSELRQEEAELSNSLQDRHSESKFDDSYRSGWVQSQQPREKSAGLEEGYKIEGARVDSVKIYESSNPIFTRYRDETNRVVLYDLEVKNHPSFSVNGLLVHNCSILKGGQGGEGKIAKNLIECTKNVKRVYIASGTPAPNDRTEYAMSALMLRQVNSEKEFYSLFFTIKDDKYVLKRHATEAFYRYLSTFSIFIRNPKAYGFNDNLKDLLPWQEIYEQVEMTEEQYRAIEKWSTQGKQQALDGFAQKPRGMTQRGKFSQISKGFYYVKGGVDDEPDERLTGIVYVDSNKPRRIAQIVQSHAPEQVIIWTVFDEEGEILLRELNKLNLRVVHISGKTKEEKRIEYINQFRHGELDVIISKPRILGFGLNFQFCHIAIFSGLADSYEMMYQSIKRIHRYGQKQQVLIYHVYTPYEEVILQNVLKKQKESQLDFDYQEKLYVNSLYNELKQFLELEDYKPMETPTISIEPVTTNRYQLYHGDSIKMLTEIAQQELKADNVKQMAAFQWEELKYKKMWLKPNSVDLSVFSPPFMGDVFTYSNNPADMGNTRGAGATGGLDEFMLQFQFFLRGMLTVTKPGRIMAMHLEDVPLRKGLDGAIGLFDFVGHAIREANEAGWILIAKVPIIKNQQMTAIVKKVSSLAMGNMETDRLRIAPCQNGTLALFRKPGDAALKVADLAKCLSCKWEGYAKQLNGWQPDRGYKSAYTLDPKTKTTIKDGETKEVDGAEYQQWLENEIAETEAKIKEKIEVPYSDLDTESIGILQDRLEKLQQKRLLWVTCPSCGSNDIVKYTEMNGNKWIIYAEGTWTDAPGMNGSYDKISKMTQEARWLDLVYTAAGVWPDINESDTLPNSFNSNDAEDADKHLCPLPIEIARRAIELYTLPGETVYTPFLGIGTEVVQALKLGRKAIGCELKPEYFMQAVRNAEKIVAESQQTNFFDLANLEYITVRSK